jgi:hypothetical protein
VRTRIKLSHFIGTSRNHEDFDWNHADGDNDLDWCLCGNQTAKYFDIPKDVDDIVMVVSSRAVPDAYQIGMDDREFNDAILVHFQNRTERVSVDCSFGEIIREHCNKAGYAYVWVEYEEKL